MREIEFRGKNKYDNRWHYGYLVYVPADNSYKITQGNVLSYFVDTDTIGQYTGLKDKNGTKIFEGDVISCETALFKQVEGIVSYSEKAGCYYINAFGVSDDYLLNCENIVVVANIYDNPELLK